MSRRLVRFVHVPRGNGSAAAYGPGDDVPARDAEKITNPKAWADDDGDDGEDEERGYRSMTVAELNAEIERRNAERAEDGQIEPESGRKDDLIAALESDDE